MQSTSSGGTSPTRGRVVWIAVASIVLALLPAARTLAGGDDLTSDEVADEIVRVQTKADDAAAALEQAEFAAEGLADDLAAAQQDVTEARGAVDALESTLVDV